MFWGHDIDPDSIIVGILYMQCERQCGVLVEILDGWKDVVMVSNLSKSTTEAAVNASVQAIQNVCAAYRGKRKRQTQKS